MVKMESLQTPQPPSKFEFLEYLKFKYLEYKNNYWPTLLAEHGYAPTLAGLETLLAETYVFVVRNMICVEISYENEWNFCFESTLELKSLAEYGYEPTLAELKLLAANGYEPTLADLESSPDLLKWFEEFQSEELRKRVSLSIFEEYFNGDWRLGQEVHKVVITQRLYQTSPNSTQE